MIMIKEIYTLNFQKDTISYIGTLRNERKFNINDNVYFSPDDKTIAKGVIVGIELLPYENPEYIYKISLPWQLVKQTPKIDVYENIECKHIFNNLEEAKESAIKQSNLMHKLQLQEIENYFKQFDK